MRTTILISAALLCLWGGASAAIAQQKTVKECEAEWRANKAQNQAQGITEKAYVVQCRAGAAPSAEAAPGAPAAPSPAPIAQQKTVKQCEAEWRANKAENQAKGVSEKSYVAECRSASAAPSAPSTASAPTAATGAPAAPAPSASSAASATPPPAAAAPPARVGAPAAANQFATVAQAKSRCPSAVVVWANLSSKIYHFSGYRDFGHTKRGAYMCEPDAEAEGFRAAKNEKHPS